MLSSLTLLEVGTPSCTSICSDSLGILRCMFSYSQYSQWSVTSCRTTGPLVSSIGQACVEPSVLSHSWGSSFGLIICLLLVWILIVVRTSLV